MRGSLKRTIVVIGCGAMVAACGSDKPAETPAQYSPTDSKVIATDTPTNSEAMGATEPTDSNATAGPTHTGTDMASNDAAVSSQPSATGQTGSSLNPVADPAPGSGGNSRPDADNTRVNKVDRGNTMTPMDQGNGKQDLSITQQIRKAVMADSSLSFSAKNVKIITSGGKVTLRGAVKSDHERDAINDSANKVAGAGNVDNQIEVSK